MRQGAKVDCGGRDESIGCLKTCQTYNRQDGKSHTLINAKHSAGAATLLTTVDYQQRDLQIQECLEYRLPYPHARKATNTHKTQYNGVRFSSREAKNFSDEHTIDVRFAESTG